MIEVLIKQSLRSILDIRALTSQFMLLGLSGTDVIIT